MAAALARRWEALAGRLGGRADVWAREGAALLTAWAEPHRAYHTLAHLAACLAELDRVRGLAGDADTLELALWFHDAVYDPLPSGDQGDDNEARSAAWARRFAEAAGLPHLADRLGALVLATRHDAVPEDADTALLVDVDLSILGQPPAVYAGYERAVRAEYAHVPDALFAAGRGRILTALLARPRIYTTPAMAERFEAAARANLAAAISALGV